MPKYKVCYDSPNNYAGKYDFYSSGSSPQILKELIEYIDSNRDRIKSIYLALYLFNNNILHNYLKDIARQGIKVCVVSIPLEGYDDTKPKNIKDLESNCITNYNATKYSLAKAIYDEFDRDLSNYKLFVFPHIYIRSSRVNPFSRGNLPYSLHIKSIYIEFKDGNGTVGLTSSNLAVRDLVKEEMMLLVEDDIKAVNEAKLFFEDLISRSYNVVDFDETQDWFHYNVDKVRKGRYYLGNYYSSPFYINSPCDMERGLSSLISKAKERVYVCAQHICAYNYFIDGAFESNNSENRGRREEGLLGVLLGKAKEGIDIKCISQTFVDEKGTPLPGGRKPENKNSFINFIKAYNSHENCKYSVNINVHSKFMVIDDTAVVTTCNFTPTQFIYLDNVNIDSFEKIPNTSYSGIHAEVGQFLATRNPFLVEDLTSYFNRLWSDKETIHCEK